MIDETGNKYGLLTVLHLHQKRNRKGAALWTCSCECGGEKLAIGSGLRRGETVSCGCLFRAKTATLKTTHGLSKHPSYSGWKAIMARCSNPNNDDYKNYGGRGIRVCDRWKSVENFIADMGIRPRGKTIDRINNDGNYEPGNCRWADMKTQSYNKRNSVILVVDGIPMKTIEITDKFGVSPDTLRKRLQSGWAADQAAKTPTRHKARAKA